MEPVQLVSNTTPQPTRTSSAAATQSVDYDAFLQLLVAQLKNQDPTSPQDPGEFLSQIASFSGVEQQIQTNERLETLLNFSLIGQVPDMIGKQITTSDGQITGTVVSVSLTQQGPMANLAGGEEVLIGPGVKISEGAEPTLSGVY